MLDTHSHISRALFLMFIAIAAIGLMAGPSRLVVPAVASFNASPPATRINGATPVTPTEDLSDSPPAESPTLPPGLVSADTSGIIAGALFLVVIICVGVFWGFGMKIPISLHLRKRNK